MGHPQTDLQNKITDLMELLDVIRTNGVMSAIVQTDQNEPRTYSVRGLYNALSTLAAQVVSSGESDIATLKEKYEHDREDVLRIVGRLAQIASSSPGNNETIIDVVAAGSAGI